MNIDILFNHYHLSIFEIATGKYKHIYLIIKLHNKSNDFCNPYVSIKIHKILNEKNYFRNSFVSLNGRRE